MSVEPVFYLLRPERIEAASEASKWLGRIVEFYAAPDAHFTPATPSTFLGGIEVKESVISDATLSTDNGKSTTIEAKLTGLASIANGHSANQGLSFTSSSIRYLRLSNHPKAFESIVAAAEVRADLANMIKLGGKPVYMIMGLLIWEDALFRDEQVQEFLRGGSAEVPVADAVGAYTGVVLPDINPGLGLKLRGIQRRVLAGQSRGSGIFAFEYRAVRRRFFTRKFSPYLGKYAERIEPGRLFGAPSRRSQAVEAAGYSSAESAMAEEDFVFEMEEDVSWEYLVDDDPESEDVNGIKVVFDVVE